MIAGIGTDIVAIARLLRLWQRHGERGAARLLTPAEMQEFTGKQRDAARPEQFAARFLAKRFAAKEAFAKAMGTGLRPPVTLDHVGVVHDALGKPRLAFAPPLTALMRQRGLSAHLSLSDEADYAVAFVVLESVLPDACTPIPDLSPTDCPD